MNIILKHKTIKMRLKLEILFKKLSIRIRVCIKPPFCSGVLGFKTKLCFQFQVPDNAHQWAAPGGSVLGSVIHVTDPDLVLESWTVPSQTPTTVRFWGLTQYTETHAFCLLKLLKKWNVTFSANVMLTFIWFIGF